MHSGPPSMDPPSGGRQVSCLCLACALFAAIPAVVFWRAVLLPSILSSPACGIFLHASMLASIGACVRVSCEAFHIPPLRKGTSVLSGFLLSCVGKHRSTLYLAPPKPSRSKSRSVSSLQSPPNAFTHSLTHACRSSKPTLGFQKQTSRSRQEPGTWSNSCCFSYPCWEAPRAWGWQWPWYS